MEAALITPPITASDSLAPAAVSNPEPLGSGMITPLTVKAPLTQIVLALLGATAFLYFARPVVLPIFLACIAAMTLKPLIRGFSCCHIPPSISAALVLCVLVTAIGIGFMQLGRPALTWMNEAPQHMTELRQRFQKLFPR